MTSGTVASILRRAQGRTPSQGPLLEPSDDASSARRWLVFGLCVTVGLASGSNYAYSAYAPQLASQLVISSTTVNLIGLAGNLGMYTTGPIWGKITDARGPTIGLFSGGLCCLIGYSTVRLYLVSVLSLRPPSAPSTADPTALRLLPMLVAMYLTGAGGSAGLSAAVNTVAKSFPDTTRATATGTVFAGFGLSAFLFSALGRVVAPGDAAGFLALLAVGTGLPMLVAAVWARAVPPASTTAYEALAQEDRVPEIIVTSESRASVDEYNGRSASLELVRSRSPATRARRSLSPSPSPLSSSSSPPPQRSYHPSELVRHPPFLGLALVLGLLCGTGLMYINNVGVVALALAREGKLEYDAHVVGGWQARMVSTISVWNCSGRILGGVISDLCKRRYDISRITFLPIVAALFIISQLAALQTTHVSDLWLVSTLLGGAYGALFNVMPMLVLEWFGIGHFSQNFGWICVAPTIGGNLFNIIFGRVYDSNTIGRLGEGAGASDSASASMSASTSASAIDALRAAVRRAGVDIGGSGNRDGQHDCIHGEACYATAFKASTAACVLALGTSVALYVHRQRAVRRGGM